MPLFIFFVFCAFVALMIWHHAKNKEIQKERELRELRAAQEAVAAIEAERDAQKEQERLILEAKREKEKQERLRVEAEAKALKLLEECQEKDRRSKLTPEERSKEDKSKAEGMRLELLARIRRREEILLGQREPDISDFESEGAYYGYLDRKNGKFGHP